MELTARRFRGSSPPSACPLRLRRPTRLPEPRRTTAPRRRMGRRSSYRCSLRFPIEADEAGTAASNRNKFSQPFPVPAMMAPSLPASLWRSLPAVVWVVVQEQAGRPWLWRSAVAAAAVLVVADLVSPGLRRPCSGLHYCLPVPAATCCSQLICRGAAFSSSSMCPSVLFLFVWWRRRVVLLSPGFSRPLFWNPSSVPALCDGHIFGIQSPLAMACAGIVDASAFPSSFRGHGEEQKELRGGAAGVVEDVLLCGLACVVVFLQGSLCFAQLYCFV